MASPGGFLYAIGAVGTTLVKIGYAKSVEKRLKILQTGQPFALQVLASIAVADDVHRIEKQIHAFLVEERRRGEWFDVWIDTEKLAALVVRAVAYLAEQEAARRRKAEAQAEAHTANDLPIFRERLLIARRRKGFSQGALAKLTGMHLTDISKMECGKMLPTAPRLRRLAQALGASADFLLGLAADAIPDEEDAA